MKGLCDPGSFGLGDADIHSWRWSKSPAGIVRRGSFSIANADVSCGLWPRGFSGDDRLRSAAELTELVRRGPGREGRVTPRRRLPMRSAGDPGLASRTGPGPAKSPPPRKKTADSSRFSTDSSLCGWKWVAARAGLGQVLGNATSCRSGRKCSLRSFSAEMRFV